MNSYAVISGIITLFVVMTTISFAMDGESGIAATTLSATIDENDTTITVASTTGFLDVDYLIIGEENLCYTAVIANTFTGITRGCNNTEPNDHVAGTRVYNEATGLLNTLVGFNIAEAMSSVGVLKVPFMLAGAIPRAFAKIISWDYSYLEGTLWSFPLFYIKLILLYPLSAGFMISFILIMVNVFMGIARIFSG
jgi:hypothetical protein